MKANLPIKYFSEWELIAFKLLDIIQVIKRKNAEQTAYVKKLEEIAHAAVYHDHTAFRPKKGCGICWALKRLNLGEDRK